MLNIYSLTVTYNDAGQFAQNVFKYQFDDGSFTDTASAALALVNAFSANKVVHIKNITPVQTTFLSLKARSLTTGGGFEAVAVFPGGTKGVRTGTVQCSGVGPVVLWGPTANAKVRGKTFFPGLSDLDCADGIYTPAFNSLVLSEMSAFLTDMTLVGGGAPTAVFGIYSRKPVATFRPAVYAELVRIPGTLRKRQRPA